MTDVKTIPGIGRTFARDLARIGIVRVADLRHKDPGVLFESLVAANRQVGHATSRNYLYVIRMAVYYANGGRDPDKLKWHAWADGTRRGRLTGT